jgi:hypothetical protein
MKRKQHRDMQKKIITLAKFTIVRTLDLYCLAAFIVATLISNKCTFVLINIFAKDRMRHTLAQRSITRHTAIPSYTTDNLYIIVSETQYHNKKDNSVVQKSKYMSSFKVQCY